MTKTVLITGSSTGIGKAAARKFAENGWNVIATMRSPEKETELSQFESVLVTKLDVQDKASIQQALTAGIDRFGRIDILVNNAGYGVFGPFELATDEQVHRQFDVNVFGVMNMTKAILPHFRAQRAGTVINISSMGGRVTFPITSLYHASKFAIEGFTESLAYELTGFNIKVKLVEPGVTSTNFDSAVSFTADPSITAYDDFTQAALENWAALNPSPAGVDEVVDVIVEAAGDGTDQLRYVAGDDARGYIHTRHTKTDQEYFEWMKNRFVPGYNTMKA
jgi:NAD(P)-dependent dehydrogenase (short-subunit alcohol dehydrogenase family)